MALEYDLFGLETSYYPHNPAFDMANDGERMRQILFLIEREHLAQLLLSHDIPYKRCLTKWGGFGYRHLLVNVIPRLRAKGGTTRPSRRCWWRIPGGPSCSRDLHVIASADVTSRGRLSGIQPWSPPSVREWKNGKPTAGSVLQALLVRDPMLLLAATALTGVFITGQFG